jgi:hypothetical protein
MKWRDQDTAEAELLKEMEVVPVWRRGNPADLAVGIVVKEIVSLDGYAIKGLLFMTARGSLN